MTSRGTAKLTSAPGWRPLTALAAVVLAVHALVLQASPVQMGSGSDQLGESGQSLRTILTGSIAAAPEAPKGTPLVAPKAAAKARPALEKAPNMPLAQVIRAQAAPELISSIEPQPAPQAADLPAQSVAASTATQAIENAEASTAPTAASAVLPAVSPPSAASAAISLPGSARLEYNVVGLSKSLNYQAKAELLWQTSGDKYEALMKVSAFLVGSRSMTSVGQITAAGLAPTRFADKFKSEQAAHFESAKGKITFSANTPDAVWVNGVQDRLSVFLQLSGMLAAKPQDFPKGSSVTFATIGPREADSWTFNIESEEMLNLMGSLKPALKLVRKPRKEFDQRVELWFAPSLGYLPVRILITQPNGDFVDQQLAKATSL